MCDGTDGTCEYRRRIDTALLVLQSEGSRLRGKLFETVEACGLPTKQEDALKRLIRRQSFDTQNMVTASLKGLDVWDGSRG